MVYIRCPQCLSTLVNQLPEAVNTITRSTNLSLDLYILRDSSSKEQLQGLMRDRENTQVTLTCAELLRRGPKLVTMLQKGTPPSKGPQHILFPAKDFLAVVLTLSLWFPFLSSFMFLSLSLSLHPSERTTRFLTSKNIVIVWEH